MKKGAFAGILAGAAVAGLAIGWWVGGPRGLDAPSVAGTVAGYEAVAPVPAPEIGFLDGEGGSVRLADFRGETLVVNFWATWCAPCVAEMPSLDRLARATREDGVRVVAIAVGSDTTEQIKAFYDRLGIEALEIYRDPTSRSLPAFRAYGLPTTVLIDDGGNWVGTLSGAAEWDSPEALALVGHYSGG